MAYAFYLHIRLLTTVSISLLGGTILPYPLIAGPIYMNPDVAIFSID
jgi:hypothetical protein